RNAWRRRTSGGSRRSALPRPCSSHTRPRTRSSRSASGRTSSTACTRSGRCSSRAPCSRTAPTRRSRSLTRGQGSSPPSCATGASCIRHLIFDQIPHPRRCEGGVMEAGEARFEHLREHSIGLPQVLFQSITHMAPAAAVAYSIFISVPQAQQALPLSVGLALIACICAATAIGQLAKLFPSAGGMYTYAAKSLGPWAGFLVAWLFILFQPLVAPFLYLEFGWAMSGGFKHS